MKNFVSFVDMNDHGAPFSEIADVIENQPARIFELADRPRHKVRVFDDFVSKGRVYDVPADSELDARLLAFALDGGLGPEKTAPMVLAGVVELAMVHTEIVEGD